MQAVATRTRTAMDEPPAVGVVAPPEPDIALCDLIRARSVLLGDRPYVEHARAEEALTFRQLEASMERWRTLLGGARARGLTTIGLVISDPIAFADIFLGALGAGFWVAPLDPSMPAGGSGGLAVTLARTGIDVVLADHPAPVGIEGEWVELDRLDQLEDGRVTRPGATTPQRAGAGGVVLSSSGTTGTPKVVRLDQVKLLHTARSVASHLQLNAEDRGFNPLPLFHINAEVVGLLSALVAGSSLVLDDRFHRTGFWDLMASRSITWINAVPAIVSRLGALRADETVPSTVRFIRSASAPLPVAAADRFEASTGIPVIETYGMTEAASQITAHPLSVPRRPGSVGLPVGLELRIVRQSEPLGSSLEAPEFHIGHVEIRGVSVIGHYVGDTHQDRFHPDGWLRTGDLGHRDADGFVYLDARTDDIINRGGEKVLPREVEEVVGADPMIASVAVVGREHSELGQVPVAFVVLRAPEADGDDVGADVAARETAERIEKVLQRDLVRAKRPVALCVVEALPAGATGKVKRRMLDTPEVPVLYTFDLR
ncbi:MAG TPA: AMP-binding protein [Acidimicrobiales bacterium]|jgi:acyl-CoA synthetase (AMP-forming)/AMP-acid ligase II|nr:AMP-binding protein [Acidimicrobiales bacterium]